MISSSGTWTLPAARSKNDRAHTLPLLPAMLAIIKAVPRMASRDQLFGQRANGFTGWSRGKAALDPRSGVKNWTTHDIRRSVATAHGRYRHRAAHHRANLKPPIRPQGWAAGIYNRSIYEREVRSALALWEDHVRSIVAGGKRKIVSMPHAAS